MSTVVKSVFKATIGLLMYQERAEMAEDLKDMDVTDPKFQSIVRHEIDRIESNMKGRVTDDLWTSITHFKSGVAHLFRLFEIEPKKERHSSDSSQVSKESSPPSSPATIAASIEELTLNDLYDSGASLGTLTLNDFDDSKEALEQAKGEFKNAYLKATEAFNNEDLRKPHRLQAIIIRVAAAILEKVDYPEDALAACMLYLEELHSQIEVKFSFTVVLRKDLRRVREKDFHRIEVVLTVCRVNRVIYDVMQVTGKVNHLMTWPCVDYVFSKKSLKWFSHDVEGEKSEKVDPLRDARVTRELRHIEMQHFCVTPWSFGQEGEEENKLKYPTGIVTSTRGVFVVADDCSLKVFDRAGKFKRLIPVPGAGDTKCYARDIAINKNDDLYVLVKLEKTGREALGVWVLQKRRGASRTFLLTPCLKKEFAICNLTVNDDNEVLVTSSNNTVYVYETQNGEFVRSFGEETLKNPSAIAVTNEGCVMVSSEGGSHICVFDAHGKLLNKFNVEGLNHAQDQNPIFAFHRESEHLVVADFENMLIYNKKGQFVRKIQHGGEAIGRVIGVTVTIEGRFAVVVQTNADDRIISKVLVV